MTGCQYIGPEQTNTPFTFCGKKTLAGKSYCEDHYWVVYKKGSSNLKGNTKAIEAEIADLKKQQEIDEVENMV
jgi:hypothetical protein